MTSRRNEAGTVVTRVGARTTAVAVRRCELRVVAGPARGLSTTFGCDRIRVGSADGVDFRVADPKVSRAHCELVLGDHGIRIRDLASTNGTVVEGVRIADAYLPARARLEIGDSEIQFTLHRDAVALDLADDDRLGRMVGTSGAMRALFARLKRIAATDVTVLLTGETGTGKDLAAEVIHELSSRAGGPLVVLDCGAVAPNLIESEVFGHERGAFTGALTARPGAFERAHRGTLFVDEIGELPLELQPRLLRALEKRTVQRLGGEPHPVDVRVIAATNRDLAGEINRGRFREDLFFRLAVAEIAIPPLRARREDIPLLVEALLAELPGSPTLGASTIELLARHDWPGNVRELRNVIERAALLGEPPASDGDLARGPGASSAPTAVAVTVDGELMFKEARRRVLDEFERCFVGRALVAHQGNASAAARAIGVDRMTIRKIADRLALWPGPTEEPE